jgi:dCTP deaminase
MLTDRLIKAYCGQGLIKIEPFDIEQLQPVSYDLTLGEECLLSPALTEVDPEPIDPSNPKTFPPLTRVRIGPGFRIHSHEFVLGHTKEYIELSPGFAAKLEGKSTMGRLGLFVHVTAGLIDPGWHGRPTVELYNVADRAIQLTPGMRIAQVTFYKLEEVARRPYGSDGLDSHYQGDMTVVASRGLESTDGLDRRQDDQGFDIARSNPSDYHGANVLADGS